MDDERKPPEVQVVDLVSLAQDVEGRTLTVRSARRWWNWAGIKRPPESPVNVTQELSSMGVNQTQATQVARWYEDCISKLDWHQQRTNLFNRMSVLFGLPIAVFAAVSGTAAFATLGEQVGNIWRLVVVTLSLTITVLSTVQTFFRFSEQAAKDQDAANQYSELRWKIRTWTNTTKGKEKGSVDSFINHVISEMQGIEARYKGTPQKTSSPAGSMIE